MNSWGRSACYPRRTFYPLSDGPSIQNHRITMSCFRTCLTRWSRSCLLDKAGPPALARSLTTNDWRTAVVLVSADPTLSEHAAPDLTARNWLMKSFAEIEALRRVLPIAQAWEVH